MVMSLPHASLDNLSALIDGDGLAGEALEADDAFDALADELELTKAQLAQAQAERDGHFSQLKKAFDLIESLNAANSELRSAISLVDAALEAVRKVRET